MITVTQKFVITDSELKDFAYRINAKEARELRDKLNELLKD